MTCGPTASKNGCQRFAKQRPTLLCHLLQELKRHLQLHHDNASKDAPIQIRPRIADPCPCINHPVPEPKRVTRPLAATTRLTRSAVSLVEAVAARRFEVAAHQSRRGDGWGLVVLRLLVLELSLGFGKRGQSLFIVTARAWHSDEYDPC